MSVDDNQKFNFFTEQIQYHNQKTNESFRFFTSLGVLIVGAYGWTLTQNIDESILPKVRSLLSYALWAVGIASILLEMVEWSRDGPSYLTAIA